MAISNDMKKLCEDIVSANDVRVKAIGVLVKDTHKMLKGFQAEHKEMATNLRGELAKGEENRLKDFKATMAEIKKFVADMVEVTAKLMEQIRKEQGERNKAVADLLEKFAKDHEVMAAELKQSLAKGETDRLEDFKEMMKGIQKYVADVVKETKRLMDEIRARQDERNKEVLDLLQEFQTEREKMAANWQALTVKMAKKRGIMPKMEAEVKVRPVKEAIKEVIEEEEVTPDMDLDEKMLQFIKKHPKGVRVGDMEETLGVVRMRLGVIAKKLLEEGKIRKEENMYFPL
ncbi:hypothetical protein KJ813_07475 [bacterium]|nr:hypothetical protein [bacterium]